MKALERCDLCGQGDFVTLFEARDRMHPVRGKFRVQQCKQCSLIFLNPQPSMAELAPHYPREAYYSLAARPSPADRATKLALTARPPLSWVLAPLKTLLRSTPIVPGGRLLDVGCGAGHFVHLARQLGMDGYGVEPSLLESRDSKIFAGTLEAARYPNDWFDVVTINHVLEHVPSPSETLRELNRILKPGGSLVVATPQADSLAYWLFGRRWVQLDVPRHLYSFSTRTLQRYAEKSKLKVISIRYNSRPFQFLGSLLYLRNDLLGTERFLAQTRVHKRVPLMLAALPLASAANLLRIGDQVEVRMTK